MQPIQIVLSKKQKTFSRFFSVFLKYTLNFESFPKKMTLIADVFPKLRSPKRMKKICTTLPLPYLLIPVNIIQLEKVYVSALRIVKIVC